MDISVVAVMERRIEEGEAELAKTRETLATCEQELSHAKVALEARAGESQSDAAYILEELTKERTLTAEQAQKIAELQNEIEDIKASHDATIDSLYESKNSLANTLNQLESELEKSMKKAEQERSLKEAMELEKAFHQERVELLQKIVAENRATIESQLTRVGELERAHAETQRQISTQLSESSDVSQSDIVQQQNVASDLELTIAQNRETIESQQVRLTTLEASYQDALDQLEALREKEAAAIAVLKEVETRVAGEVAANNARHEELLHSVRSELEESKGIIQEHVTNLTILQASYAEANTRIEGLEKDMQIAVQESVERTAAIQALEEEVAQSQETIKRHVETIAELQELQSLSDQQIEGLKKKEAEHAKFVEDLEQQLAFTFDQNQETAKRLADAAAEHERLQQENQTLVAESTAKNSESQQLIDSLNEEVASLQVRGRLLGLLYMIQFLC